MTVPALHLEVKKDGFSQLQSGNYKLTVTLNPTDLDDNAQNLLLDFIKAPMGTRYMVGMAAIGDDEQPVASAAPAASERPKKPFKDYEPSQQAGMRCQDEQFWKYLRTFDWECRSERAAANFVRTHCVVMSRAELDTDPHGKMVWLALSAEYEQWAGLSAVER